MRFIGATPKLSWQGGLAAYGPQTFIGATPTPSWQGGLAGDDRPVAQLELQIVNGVCSDFLVDGLSIGSTAGFVSPVFAAKSYTFTCVCGGIPLNQKVYFPPDTTVRVVFDCSDRQAVVQRIAGTSLSQKLPPSLLARRIAALPMYSSPASSARWKPGLTGFGTAFGLDVPTPLPGNPNRVAKAKTTGYNYCGDAYGFQTMLKDLGYYRGMIDGNIGTGTITAAMAAAQQLGVPLQKGSTINNDFCQALMDAWEAKFGTTPAPPTATPPTVPTTTPPAVPPTTTPPPAEPPPNGNGNGTAIQPANGKGWWAQQSKETKIAIGVGGVAAVGLLLYAASK